MYNYIIRRLLPWHQYIFREWTVISMWTAPRKVMSPETALRKWEKSSSCSILDGSNCTENKCVPQELSRNLMDTLGCIQRVMIEGVQWFKILPEGY
jgi:hypothetical protein